MESVGSLWMWVGFAIFVLVACVIDLVVLQKEGAHKVSVSEALKWSALWVFLVRGVVFVLLGVAFLSVNLVLARKKARSV